MVCKEELCSWFQNLSPHKRIDYLCGMLHICLPMELRFVGSYVEDLAKKDFVHLREHESKANSREDLSKFSEIDAKSFRTKMAIYLALLRSSNRPCSSIIYQLLENNIKQTLTVMDNMDEMTVHNILLVLSMAMNHPAFSYHEKMRMYEYYNMAIEAASHLSGKTQVYREPELLIPSLILSESCETRGCDQSVSPAISPHVAHHPIQHSAMTSTAKIYVTQIELRGSRQSQYDSRTLEYKLQVTWSNGEKKEVYKTNQEISDFQSKLKQKFPDEPGIQQQTVLISDSTGPQINKSELTDHLSLYVQSISRLPPHIQQSPLFNSFFGPSIQQPVQMTDASTSPRPQNGLDLPLGHHHSNTSGDIQSLSPHSPAHLELGYNGPAHSPSFSTKTTSPLISSPSCQSPVSSVDSASNSHPSSPSPHDTELNNLISHLRSINLSLYIDNLESYSLEQLHEMRPEEIESLGLPKEVVVTLKSSIDVKMKLKRLKGPHLQNGLVDPTPTVLMYPPPPHPFLPPPNMQNPLPFPHPIHPPFYQNIYGFHHFPNPVVTGLQETSPTNSECSSPSQSPHLPSGNGRQSANVPVTDSSSEDSDRDKQSSQPKHNKWKPHSSGGGSSQPAHPDQVKDDVRPDSCSNSGTPPLNLDKQAPNVKTGHNGNSGYTSDPTYNAPRPQFIRPPPYNKAMPAHTNLSIPPKYIINMPENNFKGGPMSIPQHLREVTLTTGNNFHGYVFSSDPSHRPLFPVAGVHPAILNRSQMNYVPKSVIQPGLLTSTQSPQQTGSQTNVSSNNNAGKIIPGTPGLVLPIPPPVSMATAQSVQTNSVGNGNNSDTKCGHNHTNSDTTTNLRVSVIPSSSMTTSSTVTQSVAGQNSSNNQCMQASHSSCSSCGCPGHTSTGTAPINFMPQIQQNIWPYTNGLIPVQTMYMPHTQYLNGLHQDQLFSHTYGLVNHGNQGVGNNVPNYVYGYNYYNSNRTPNNSTAGVNYSKKVKKTYCSNCGSNKHMAVDCTEITMEAMSGHIRYSYKNDSD